MPQRAAALSASAPAPWLPEDVRRLRNSSAKKIENAKILNFATALAEKRAREKADQQEPIDKFSEFVRREPKNPLGYYNRGRSYLEAEDYDRAIADFDLAILLDPNNAAAYNNRGIAYYYKGDLPSAIANCDQSIRLNRNFSAAYINRATAFHTNGEFDHAITDYTHYIRLNPRDAHAYYDRARALTDRNEHNKKNDLDLAIADFRKAIILNVDDPLVHDDLAFALELRNDCNCIDLHDYNEHINLVPSSPLGYFDRAEMLANNGDLDLAIADYDRAIDLSQNQTRYSFYIAEIHHCRGNTYLKKHKFCEAFRDLREALQLDRKLNNAVQNSIETSILLNYNLHVYDHENIHDGHNLPIPTPELRELIREYSARLVENLRELDKPPFPILRPRDVAAVIAHGKKYPWDMRRDRGWPYHINAFKFLHITYARWIGRGLTREHLAAADPSLHTHLTRKISLEGMPEWLDVPTGPEARLRAIADPVERMKREAVREYKRDEKRITRSRKATLGD